MASMLTLQSFNYTMDVAEDSGFKKADGGTFDLFLQPEFLVAARMN